MIRKFDQFIKENSDSGDIIENLIEDCFLPICDDYDMDYQVMKGYFVNGGWITMGMIDYIKKMMKEKSVSHQIKNAYNITFLPKDSWKHQSPKEIGDYKGVYSLNKDFKSCVDKFNRWNITSYSFVHLPEEITSTAWQISFYLVEN